MKVILMDETEVEELIRKVSAATLAAFREEINLDENNQPREAGQFVDKKGAAKILGCSVSSIEQFARLGKLKKHLVGAKAVRFQRSEVLGLISRKAR